LIISLQTAVEKGEGALDKESTSYNDMFDACKDKVKVDLWKKDIAPSNLLRKWFNHDEKKWNEFKRNYFKELDQKSELVNVILRKEKEKPSSTITLLYGTKENKFNNATALREYLEEKIKKYSG
jgi:uncharacterized protein YeaO (DUF488 family)